MLLSYFSFADLHRVLMAAEKVPVAGATKKDLDNVAFRAYATNTGHNLWNDQPLSSEDEAWLRTHGRL